MAAGNDHVWEIYDVIALLNVTETEIIEAGTYSSGYYKLRNNK
jgi:hypothetical protein